MTITITDRKLIDAAVAAGMVRKIPRGVSGLPEQGRDWREIGRAILANQQRAARLNGAKVREIQRVERAATKEGVNLQIKEMRLAGMTFDDIAASLGYAKSLVWRRCRQMNIA